MQIMQRVANCSRKSEPFRLPVQILRIMRISFFLLLACGLHVSARTSSQTLSFSGRAVPIKKVFIEIKKQTGYSVLCSKSSIEHSKPVTIYANNLPLREFLDLVFKDQPFKYSIDSRTIVVTPSSYPVVRPPTFEHPAIPKETIQPVTGRITDSLGNPLSNATVVNQKTNKTVYSGNAGSFTIDANEGDVLLISYVGYETRRITVTSSMFSDANNFVVTLNQAAAKLDEISVVSTGYEMISKERSTGSFAQVDNELFNRSVSTDVLSRLKDVVPGLTFDNFAISGQRNKTGIFIRGQNSIATSTDPLIIIDNFPYEGDLNNINPNDVLSVSVLKDAAAASIWGARAGNGVIVITTKKGQYGQKPLVAFNSNITISEKPDLYYIPKIKSEDYIEMEKTLFAQGFYNSTETSVRRTALTPVVELLIKKRDGLMDPEEVDREIESLKAYDVRKDYERYFLQHSLNQQYALNVSGGSASQRYFVSAGYDKNIASVPGNSYDRVTINATNNYRFLREKLEVGAGVYFTSGLNKTNDPGIIDLEMFNSTRLYPYARLVDENGNALAIRSQSSTSSYRDTYTDTAGGGKLLDWKYRPLDELRLGNNSTRQTDYRIDANLKYKILSFLSAEALYQYNSGANLNRKILSAESFEVRDLINKFSIINPDGSVTRPIPPGGIADRTNASYTSHNIRMQLRLHKTWNAHEISALAGWELRDKSDFSNSSRYYGYDERYGTTQPVSYTTRYTYYHNKTSTTNLIPRRESESEFSDRFRSYYANASYTYEKKYVLYGSARIDQSNIFGVATNQKSVPLWSVGAAWNVDRELFYRADWLPVLKLRASYGYTGNVDKTLSAYTTASISGNNGYGNSYASIRNPPNPDLRWEQIGIANIGVDFATRNNWISGSFDVYRKKGIDLIGQMTYPGQTGVTSFKGNSANTLVRGIDITINTNNLNGALSWNTAILFSALKEKVTKYALVTTASYDMLELASLTPRVGNPLYGVYSYRWGGLDPATGDPIGYLGKEKSTDYTAIYTETMADDLVYHGPGRPTIYGAVRNSFSFKGITVSANIAYRLGYYVRKESLNYTSYLSGVGTHGDFYNRWQKPGDEALTDIPSVPAVANFRRDNLFTFSSALVSRGDLIRLQDVTLSYDLTKDTWKNSPFQRIQLYAFANNLGLLWTANKWGLDPESLTTFRRPAISSFSIGFKAEL